MHGPKLALAMVACACASLANAQQQTAKDHPLVSRYQGSEVASYKATDFDAFEIPLGPIVKENQYTSTQRVEGRVTKFKYTVPANRSGLEVTRNYKDALQKAGFQILWDCEGGACLDPKFPYGYTDTNSGVWCKNCEEPMHYLAAKLARPTGDAYVALVIEKDKFEGGTWLTIVETKAMAGGMVNVNAQAMANDIASSGHVALYGIYFDTGKSTIKPESKMALDEIAKLLNAQTSLRLHVVGHTDNVGQLPANMTLSKQRAEAVVNALVNDYHIAPARLIGNGVGPLAPVASNQSEDGRAKNRRVELVAQ